ncbi:MAG: hypothetical protein L0332_33550 [Chloroflexi bacterium]|nr:hypothetical protein [Chloroflexota bacterium]
MESTCGQNRCGGRLRREQHEPSLLAAHPGRGHSAVAAACGANSMNLPCWPPTQVAAILRFITALAGQAVNRDPSE